jgi:hypothetical protein
LSVDQLAALETKMGITGLDLGLLDYLRRSDSLVSCVRLLVSFSPDTDQSAPDTSTPRLHAPAASPERRNREARCEAKLSTISSISAVRTRQLRIVRRLRSPEPN